MVYLKLQLALLTKNSQMLNYKLAESLCLEHR
jgi:hypothetical protein